MNASSCNSKVSFLSSDTSSERVGRKQRSASRDLCDLLINSGKLIVVRGKSTWMVSSCEGLRGEEGDLSVDLYSGL